MDNAERMAEVLEDELRKVKEGTSDGFAILRFKKYQRVPGEGERARVSSEMGMFNPRQSNLLHIASLAIRQVLSQVMDDTDGQVSHKYDQDGNEIAAEINTADGNRRRAAKGWTN